AFRARAPDALVPCHAAAEQIAAQLDLRAVAAGIGEAFGVENLLNVPVADDRLHDGLAGPHIDRDDLVQFAQVDEQAAIPQRRLAPIVTAAADHDLPFVFPREMNRGDDVLLVLDPDHDLRRAAGNQPIPQVAVDQFGEVRIAPPGDDAFAGFLQRVNVHGRAFRSVRAAAAVAK